MVTFPFARKWLFSVNDIGRNLLCTQTFPKIFWIDIWCVESTTVFMSLLLTSLGNVLGTQISFNGFTDPSFS